MGTASFQFLGFALAVALVFNLRTSVAWRQTILLIASLGFLAFFTRDAAALAPLIGFLAIGFVGLRLIQTGVSRIFVPLLIGLVVVFIWLKKYTFLPADWFLAHPYLTLGLSYIFFRVLHLIIDAHAEALPHRVGLVSYLNYTLNFTTLVSGPIQRYEDFSRMQLAPVPLPLNLVIASRSLERIIIGFFKVNVLSLAFSLIRSHALQALDAGDEGSAQIADGVIIAAGYPLYLYCNFSGYIDMVIGIARFLRMELPENFNRPFSSDNFMNFWSSWHITLSSWLKTYVYSPLLIVLMRRWPGSSAEPYFGVFAFFVTFFLIGIWHGQTSEFVFYGVVLALGVSLTKLHQIIMVRLLGRRRFNALGRNGLYEAVARGLTYTWFTLSLLWFWGSWTELGHIAQRFSGSQMAEVWVTIFLGAAVILSAWEFVRNRIRSFEFEQRPFVESRYVRVVEVTFVAVVTLSTMALLNAPAPDIVYKAF